MTHPTFFPFLPIYTPLHTHLSLYMHQLKIQHSAESKKSHIYKFYLFNLPHWVVSRQLTCKGGSYLPPTPRFNLSKPTIPSFPYPLPHCIPSYPSHQFRIQQKYKVQREHKQHVPPHPRGGGWASHHRGSIYLPIPRGGKWICPQWITKPRG